MTLTHLLRSKTTSLRSSVKRQHPVRCHSLYCIVHFIANIKGKSQTLSYYSFTACPLIYLDGFTSPGQSMTEVHIRRLSIIIVLFSSVITHCYASLDWCFDENVQASGCWKPLTSQTRRLLAWTASPWNLAPSTVTLHTDSIRMHSFPSPQSRLMCSACVLHVFWAAPLQTVMVGKRSQLF